MDGLERTQVTRMELLRVTKRLRFLKDGRNMLEVKADVLVDKMQAYHARLKRQKEDAFINVTAAFQALKMNEILFGEDSTSILADVNKTLSSHVLTIDHRSVEGLTVPRVSCHGETKRRFPRFGFTRTSAFLDTYATRIQESIHALVEVTNMENTLLAMAREYMKVRRRINALDEIIIPRHEHIIKTIDAALEALAVEEFTRLKIVKEKMNRARARGGA